MAERLSTVQIGKQDDGSGRVFTVRTQTYGLRRDLAELVDRLFAFETEEQEALAELTGVARKLEELGTNTGGNGFDRELAEKLRTRANEIGVRIRELEDGKIEARIRIIARRLEPVDEDWLLDKLDERRIEELETELTGRPRTPPTPLVA